MPERLADAVVLINIAKKRGNRYFNLPGGEQLHIILKYVEFINLTITKTVLPHKFHLNQHGILTSTNYHSNEPQIISSGISLIPGKLT